MDVPVLIFSAGLGDLIHVMLDQQAKDHDNIKVVSNYMRFDEEVKELCHASLNELFLPSVLGHHFVFFSSNSNCLCGH